METHASSASLEVFYQYFFYLSFFFSNAQRFCTLLYHHMHLKHSLFLDPFHSHSLFAFSSQTPDTVRHMTHPFFNMWHTYCLPCDTPIFQYVTHLLFTMWHTQCANPKLEGNNKHNSSDEAIIMVEQVALHCKLKSWEKKSKERKEERKGKKERKERKERKKDRKRETEEKGSNKSELL
jgi:hypothetical protein